MLQLLKSGSLLTPPMIATDKFMTEYNQVMKLQKLMYVSMDNIDPPSVLCVILSAKLNQNCHPTKAGPTPKYTTKCRRLRP